MRDVRARGPSHHSLALSACRRWTWIEVLPPRSGGREQRDTAQGQGGSVGGEWCGREDDERKPRCLLREWDERPLDPIGNPETVVNPCKNGDCGRRRREGEDEGDVRSESRGCSATQLLRRLMASGRGCSSRERRPRPALELHVCVWLSLAALCSTLGAFRGVKPATSQATLRHAIKKD